MIGWPTSDVGVVAACGGRAGCDGSGGGVAEVGLDGGGLGATGGTYLMLIEKKEIWDMCAPLSTKGE